MFGKKKKNIIDTEDQLKSFVEVEDYQRCLIIDESTGVYGYRELKSTLIPEGSIPVNDEGVYTHYLIMNGKLEALNYLPTDNKDKTPEDCFEAQYWEELYKISKFGKSLFEKIQIGLFVGIIVGLLIILLMIGLAAMG